MEISLEHLVCVGKLLLLLLRARQEAKLPCSVPKTYTTRCYTHTLTCAAELAGQHTPRVLLLPACCLPSAKGQAKLL